MTRSSQKYYTRFSAGVFETVWLQTTPIAAMLYLGMYLSLDWTKKNWLIF